MVKTVANSLTALCSGSWTSKVVHRVMQSAFVQSATWVRGAPQRNACPARRRELLRSCAQEERRLPEGVGPAEPPVPNFGFVGAEKLGVSFTCTAGDCGTRISKMIRRSSYEKGTVLIQCPTCRIKHIISDNLGWYSDTASNLNNIEKIAESKGERVIRVDSRVFGLESLMSRTEDDSTEVDGRTSRQEDEG